MIHLGKQKYSLIRLSVPPEKLPEVIDTESKMDAILADTISKDNGSIFYYVGPNTNKYTRFSYYVLAFAVEVVTNSTSAAFEIYESDGAKPIGEPITILPNDYRMDSSVEIIKTVPCLSGFLYFKLVDTENSNFRPFIIDDGKLSVEIDAGGNKMIKVQSDGRIRVYAKYKNTFNTSNPLVTVDARNTNFGKFLVYDTDNPLKANEKTLLATFCGGLNNSYKKASFTCTSGHLYFKADETDSGGNNSWHVFNNDPKNSEIIAESKLGKIIKIKGDTWIRAYANTIRLTDDLFNDKNIEVKIYETYNKPVYVYDGKDADTGTLLAILGGTDSYAGKSVFTFCESGGIFLALEDADDSMNNVKIERINFDGDNISVGEVNTGPRLSGTLFDAPTANITKYTVYAQDITNQQNGGENGDI